MVVHGGGGRILPTGYLELVLHVDDVGSDSIAYLGVSKAAWTSPICQVGPSEIFEFSWKAVQVVSMLEGLPGRRRCKTPV